MQSLAILLDNMKNLKQLLHKMLIIGFDGEETSKNDILITDIQKPLNKILN